MFLIATLVLTVLSCFNFAIAKKKNGIAIFAGIGCLLLAVLVLIIGTM